MQQQFVAFLKNLVTCDFTPGKMAFEESCGQD
jgi:hypothetical protein